MVNVMHLYMDDSGTRHPDRHPGQVPEHGRDWFGQGGVLVKQEDEQDFRDAHAAFRKRWDFTAPLHSSEIRGRAESFAWLGTLSREEHGRFLEELYQLMATARVTGMACVIDRPGYNHRYRERYGRQRWSLCKTAFAVAVERSAKLARSEGYKLKVFAERCDAKTDRWMRGYYDALRTEGMPFSTETSGKYAPLPAAALEETLYEFKTKAKSSPVMQLADLYLWPMCIGGYDAGNMTYARLREDRKLIDCLLAEEDVPALGIKYSCWEAVDGPENN
jgi:hypothetical protein